MIDSVVSNSGPLMVFSKLNILDLFKELYGKISFPAAVYKETVIKGIEHGFEDAHNLRVFLNKNNWNHTEIREIPRPIISANLDKGEKEAIVLALLKQGMLLMDEELGRTFARSHGLKVKGSLGVLIQAYKEKIITFRELDFYFGEIINRHDIWISPILCKQLLQKLRPV